MFCRNCFYIKIQGTTKLKKSKDEPGTDNMVDPLLVQTPGGTDWEVLFVMDTYYSFKAGDGRYIIQVYKIFIIFYNFENIENNIHFLS